MGRTVLALCSLTLVCHAALKLSPFTEVTFEGDTPVVRYDGTEYELIALNGVEAGKILAYCKERYGGKWEKRFAEDLFEVLVGMGNPPGKTVSLTLKNRKTGKQRKVAKARMTRANRDEVYSARHGRRRRTPAVTRPLSAADAKSDMAYLKEQLAQHHSYCQRTEGSLDSFVWNGADTDSYTFARYVAKQIATLGDGHTRVRGSHSWLPRGYAPFATGIAGGRVVVLAPDGRELLDKRYPYLHSLDGVPVAKWFEATGAIVAHGSPQFRLTSGAKRLEFINFLRGELGLKVNPTLRILLEDEKGKRTRNLTLPLADAPARRAAIARGESRMLKGKIAYMRIRSMEGDAMFKMGITAQLQNFAQARGLIIDVRGNGGGTRDALRLILPRLLEAPRVVNAAVYRIPDTDRPASPDGHLANRFLYPKSWTEWTDQQRGAIARFNRTFEPEWEPSLDKFTAWHYMVVDPAPRGQRYRGKVVILMDGRCFSATDIFLAGFKGVANVTLMGTASGGGSGRSGSVTLARSGLELRVSTMASFQPTGKFYDGNGVQPDVVVKAMPSDWTGETDTQLAAATKRLSD